MQNMITWKLLASVSEDGFSLDELVDELGKLSQAKGLPGIVAMILRLVDEMLLRRQLEGRAWPGRSCCAEPAYESRGLQKRRLATSIGVVEFSLRRYRCTHCRQGRVPLRDFLGLAPGQRHSNELERVVVEVVTEQSYRRSSSHLEGVGGVAVPKSTAHRWVVQSDSDALEPAGEKLDTLLADGTGFNRRPNEAAGMTNRGEVRMAVGISRSGAVAPLGTWAGQSWQQIAADLSARSPEGGKLAGMLVSDGEAGLAEALGPLADDQQRCLWHLTHDLNPILWKDDAPLAERRELQKQLAAVVRIELPAEDGCPVAAEHRRDIEQRMRQAEGGVTDLIADLLRRGYIRAATYVRQAQSRLFSYLRFWLAHGIVNPKVSSFIERLMREVGRRLKRIGFGWKDDNAAQMARLILKRITDPQAWLNWWKKRLRLDGKVLLAFRGVEASAP